MSADDQLKTGKPITKDQDKHSSVSRRDLLRGATLATGVTLTSSVLAPGAAARGSARGATSGSLAEAPVIRAQEAMSIRFQRANANRREGPISPQQVNDDETRLPDYIGSFSKTLKHNARGEVRASSYRSLIDALKSADPADFEAIEIGRENDVQRNRLVSPQGAYAFEMSGLDGNANRVPPAPAFDGAITEAEMAEMYWYSVTRDIPFSEYSTRRKIRKAAEDLSRFSRADIFPTDTSGRITPTTLFRGGVPLFGISAPGVLDGPFVSQFLLLPFQIGQLEVEQRYPKLERGGANQFMTKFADWLSIQRGYDPNAGGNPTSFTNARRYIARMRDLSEWVHRDFPLQSPLHALSVIFGFGTDDAFDPALPYTRIKSATQGGFATFGLADITHLTVHAPRQALTGAWFQKWLNHRRARPEVYGGRLNVQARGERNYGLGSDLLGSKAYEVAVNEIRRVNGTPGDRANDGLLPMGFPEGSPAHPAYPGGHSSFIAAGVTVLKAFVNEDFVIPEPKVPNRNGTELLPYAGTLTIGGELNKLVGNITHARDAAGMHWRSDGVGNLIGEAAAIALLKDYSIAYNEQMDGLTLRKFNGQRIRIHNGNVQTLSG